MSFVFKKIYDTLVDLYDYAKTFPFSEKLSGTFDYELRHPKDRMFWTTYSSLGVNYVYQLLRTTSNINLSIDNLDDDPSYNEFMTFMGEDELTVINAEWAEQQYRLLDYIWGCNYIIDSTLGTVNAVFPIEYTIAEAKANALTSYENAITSGYMNVTPISPMMSQALHSLNTLGEDRYKVVYAGHYFEQSEQPNPDCVGKAFFRVTYRATDPDYSEYFPTIEGVPETIEGDDDTYATIDLPEFDFTIQQCDDDFYIEGLELPYIDLPFPSVDIGTYYSNVERVTLLYKNAQQEEDE